MRGSRVKNPAFFSTAAKLGAEFTQCTRNAMLDRSRLSVHAAAATWMTNIKFVESVRSLKRLLHDHSVRFRRRSTVRMVCC